jgi:RNA polymerase sigma-70 factor (ECF subfamily)
VDGPPVARAWPIDALRVDVEARAPAVVAPRTTPRRAPSGALAREALKHLDSLHRFAHYLAGSSSEAEDLVQDTYARALGAESSFAPATNMRAWLFRILRNSFIDDRRRSKTLPLLDDSTEEERECAEYAPELLRGDVEREALRRVVGETIEGALALLSPDARAVVLLDLEGFTETEASEVLGCPIGTIKSRLGRARDALRRHLSEYQR